MLKSFEKNRTGILLMCLSSICVCSGQLFWKLAFTQNEIYLFLGFAVYGLGACIMMLAYKFGSLSVLQPMLCLNYILAIFLSHLFLKETITPMKLFGIVAIIIGVIMIGGGDD